MSRIVKSSFEYLSGIVSILITLIVLWVSLKSCVVTTIPKIENPIKYFAKLKNGEEQSMILTNNQLVIVKRNFGLYDCGVYSFKRHSATYYGAGIYNVDSGNSPFGIRYYPDINNVWLMSLRLEKTFGTAKPSTFSNIGIKYDEVFKFDEKGNLLQSDGELFKKMDLNKDELELVSTSITTE